MVRLDFELILNVWSLLFIIIVIIIRIRVLFFSWAYMRSLMVGNFFLLYRSFIFRMVWLILRNNFYWIILGWDGLGVVSFLLIVFYMRNERISNGIFTLFQNRLGDLFFVLFILINLNIEIWRQRVIKVGLVLIVIGACVKRAQFPFNSWLLAAIRAPTPISSLVHSSTLVVAGVYILLQYSYCLVDVIEVLKILSLLTLLIRRFGLLTEGDIKKLIAYSTMNHVGLIIYIIRFKLFKIVYFHLNIHAIFKSMIFICFGFVILVSYHRQDKRLVSYAALTPVIKILYLYSCLCLAGLPILSGFFSKDFFIEKIIEFNFSLRFLLLLLLFLSIRIYYSIKLIMLSSVRFVYVRVEVNYLRMISVALIILIRVLIINLFLSLVYRLRLELLSYKLSIYLGVMFFFFLRMIINLNIKITSFVKELNFAEIWRVNVLKLDFYVYWVIIELVKLVRVIGNLKLIYVYNWWVVLLFIWLVYEKSFKSVTLKKSRLLSYFLRCEAFIIFVDKV